MTDDDLTEVEKRLRANPELLAEIEHSMAHPETWVQRERPQRRPAPTEDDAN